MNERGKPIAVSTYAKHRGCSPRAVRDAISTGRLTARSVVYIADKPKICDVEAADLEWAENTQSTKRNVDALEVLGVPLKYVSEARRSHMRAELLALDLAERRGELVDANEVGAAWEKNVQATKTKLLGVGVKLKQRLPHLTTDDVAVVQSLIREVLEGLADG